jgi:hypothetical protein
MNTAYRRIRHYFKSLLNPSIIVSLLGVLVSLIILIVTIKSNHKESIAVAKHSQYLSWLKDFTSASSSFVDVEIIEAGKVLDELASIELAHAESKYAGDELNYSAYYQIIDDFIIKATTTYTKYYFYLPIENSRDAKEKEYCRIIENHHGQLMAVLSDVHSLLELYRSNVLCFYQNLENLQNDTIKTKDVTRLNELLKAKDLNNVSEYDEDLFDSIMYELCSQINNQYLVSVMREFVEYEKSKIQEPLTEI